MNEDTHESEPAYFSQHQRPQQPHPYETFLILYFPSLRVLANSDSFSKDSVFDLGFEQCEEIYVVVGVVERSGFFFLVKRLIIDMKYLISILKGLDFQEMHLDGTIS